jgi:hypothetical protein
MCYRVRRRTILMRYLRPRPPRNRKHARLLRLPRTISARLFSELQMHRGRDAFPISNVFQTKICMYVSREALWDVGAHLLRYDPRSALREITYHYK